MNVTIVPLEMPSRCGEGADLPKKNEVSLWYGIDMDRLINPIVGLYIFQIFGWVSLWYGMVINPIVGLYIYNIIYLIYIYPL